MTVCGFLCKWLVAPVVLSLVLMRAAIMSPEILDRIDIALDRRQTMDGELLRNCTYLNENYAPTAEEHTHLAMELLQGSLPKDLDGLFVRVGPNPVPAHLSKKYHWFDGHGMMHTVRLRGGETGGASYSNGWLRTPRFNTEQRLQREYFTRVGELTGFVGLFKALFVMKSKPGAQGLRKMRTGQANTHTLMFNNKFYANHEASLLFEVFLNDDGSFRSGDYDDFGGLLDFPVSAHPKVAQNGNLVFHGYSSDPVLQAAADGASVKLGEVTADGQPLYYYGLRPDLNHTSFAHDMAITEHFALTYDMSVHFEKKAMFDKSGSFFQFKKDHKLSFSLSPRKKGASAKDRIDFVDDKAYVVIHPLNAWEQDADTVVVWTPRGEDWDGSLQRTDVDNRYHMTKYVLNVKTGEMKTTIIDRSMNVEFVRIRDGCMGIFCRYGFGGTMDTSLGGDGLFSGYSKWDMQDDKLQAHVSFVINGTQCVGGEPVIMDKVGSGPTESDKVYVGSFLQNPVTKESLFAVYDGETASAEPVAVLRVPVRVPYGFHGNFVGAKLLREHIAAQAKK